MLISIILVAMTALGSTSTVFDLNKIFTKYAATCGLNFCNVSSIPLPYFNESLTRFPFGCSPCSCYDCILNKNCCPDIGMYLTEVKCINDVIYSPYNEESGFYFAVIDSCPVGTNQKILNLCRNITTLTDKLTLTPVTSRFGKTYRNIYCAECNGEMEAQSWSFDIKCKEFVDFNFLSTFHEILDMIKLKSCTVMYVNSNVNYHVQRCEPERNDLIRKCNTTGTWMVYDYDIEWACNHFQLPFENFRNIFCLMCNPPLQSNNVTITEECLHEIGMEKSIELETACRLYETSSVTIPFKNIFCYQCNKQNTVHRYTDIDGDFTIVINEYNQVSYTMSGSKFTTDFLSQYLVSSNDKPMINNNAMTRLNSSYIFYDEVREVNLTNLISQYTSQYGPEICGIYNPNDSSPPPPCVCAQGCLSTPPPSCCIDFELDQHHSCVERRVMTTVCRYADEGLNSNCSRRGSLIFDVPVSRMGENYGNVFCGLCADDFVNSESLHPVLAGQQFSPWNIQITCPLTNVLSVHFQMSLKDIIDTANQINCNITFQPNQEDVTLCDDMSKTINTCNVSGTWTSLDADVLWACEKLNNTYLSSYMGYRNVFCTLCNPNMPLFPTTTTSVPERTTLSVRYCQFCLSTGIFISFRSFFQIRDHTEKLISVCEENEVLDKLQNKCRKVTCSPGYMLVNNTCEPLLQKNK